MENFVGQKHTEAVITLQSQLHRARERRASGEQIIRPWASTSVNFGVETVRVAPKPAGKAAPCKEAWKAAKRIFAPAPPAERYTL